MKASTFAFQKPLSSDNARRPPFGIIRVERERLVYEDFYAGFLRETYPFRDDLKRVASAADARLAARPPSVLLAMSILSLGDHARRVAAEVEAYDRRVPLPDHGGHP
jgi:hypothetical protein